MVFSVIGKLACIINHYEMILTFMDCYFKIEYVYVKQVNNGKCKGIKFQNCLCCLEQTGSNAIKYFVNKYAILFA